jgi:hypothetical protein
VPGSLHAAQPAIRNLDVHGLQAGGKTTLVIDGDELGKTPRLLLPFAVKQERKPGGTDKRAVFEVAVGAVEPGYYSLRVQTAGGVSLPVTIAVDRLPQRPLAASTEALPVALHGRVNGSTVAQTRFVGKAGQKIMVEVEAERMGGKLRPVVHLVGPRRQQVAWAWPTPALFGDARLQATLPVDGDYTLTVHDSEYAGQDPGFFRLKVGQWSFVDQVFPPVVGKGTHTVELLGPAAPAQVKVAATRPGAAVPLAWPTPGDGSGPRPFVVVGLGKELLEQPSAGKAQELPAGRVGVSGRLLTAFEEDRYRIPVKPGGKLRLEVFAERHGSPLDVALVVHNDKGDVLARAEDAPGTLDPQLEYTVPPGVTALVVAVVDAQGRSGPRGVYRLVVEPQPPAATEADFRLYTPSQQIALPQGGSSVLPVLIERHGYAGRVVLAAEGLPAGVQLEGAEIPAGAEGTLVTIRRGTASGDAVFTHWRGRSDGGEEREVVVRGHPLERVQPWLAQELVVGLSEDRAASFQIAWGKLPADVGLIPGKKLELPVKLTRTDSKPVVRLTLLTSQAVLLVNGQPDLNQALRAEAPVELAPGVNEGKLGLLAPAKLNAPAYDVTVHAELLGPDRRIVLAEAFAPVRHLKVRKQAGK